METPAHKDEKSQPEFRKQIRLAVAKICSAMDAEIENEAAAFVELWVNQYDAHYKVAASGESNPSPLPNEPIRPAN